MQSFNTSLRRNCVWVNPENASDIFVMTDQFCGSHFINGEKVPYLDLDNQTFTTAKGYTCPENSLCMTVENPYSGTVSFDNILQSLELVFVLMSVNTFSDLMYNIVDSEYLVASLFFIFGTLALGLWLANLFIAVIVSSFQTTREEMGGHVDRGDPVARINALFSGNNVHVVHVCRHTIGRWYHYLRDVPLILIMVDLITQCTVSYHSSQEKINGVYQFEIFVTAFLALEIILRFIVYLPRWRLFLAGAMNCIDTTLAVATCIILIPRIRDNTILYGWLSGFQVARFYRIVIAIGFVRDLWARVLSNFKPILNITLFYYLITYLAAILACLLLRGVIPLSSDGEENFLAFQHLANSFVAMYIISSTENWTESLYIGVESANTKFSQACIAAFFIGWYILSNFVVLNMFVAIITENLEISPEGKRKEQIKAFVIDTVNEQSRFNYFGDTRRMLMDKFKKKKRGGYEGQTALQLLQRDRMDTFLIGENEREQAEADADDDAKNSRSLVKDIIWVPGKIVTPYFEKRRAVWRENPFHDSNEIKEYSGEHHSSTDAIVSNMIEAKHQLETQRKEYLQAHPDYNKSLKMFSVDNKFRRFCQRIVAPAYGTRLEGANPRPMVWYLFSVFMLLATVGLVAIAIVATPSYYKTLADRSGNGITWITLTDAIFVGVFSAELVIKVVADGFYYTPNAYLRSIWGVIDFLVLITLWINLIQELSSRTTLARLIRAFKALRALRLLSFSAKAQELFHIVIIVGIWKLFTAAIVALGLLFPFALWGMNIFRGRILTCNSDDFTGNLTACFGEYENSPFNWDVLSPMSVTRTYYDFDNFGHSLLILFEIISLEGWTDLLQSVMNITEYFHQPEYYGSPFNGTFVMFYNLIGTIFILTLFISVIIQNYSVMRGSAYMTDEQRTWYEIEKTLKIVRPSMRPPHIVPGSFRHKLLMQIVKQNSWFNIIATGNLVVLAIILMTEYYPRSNTIKVIREFVLLIFTFTYLVMVLLRLYALGTRKFIRRKWDIYALVVSVSSFVLDFIAVVAKFNTTFYNFQKLCLVGMLTLLIPRSRRLDQLLKTCATSASALGNMIIVWFILFLGYGIAFNQVFGLTRLGPNGSPSINFRSVSRALVLLYRMSLGEGWNQVLNDYLVEYPECYVSRTGDGYTDCGSHGYAYSLFISWNIISMYVFANMFVSLIYENFSFVSRKPDSNINRDEIRKFKAAWFEFDPNSTGYIPRDKLYELLAKLDGYFSLHIHEEGSQWSVRPILEHAKARTDNVYEVDTRALNKELRPYPAELYTKRRHEFEKFCQHAFLLSHPDRGINFHALLIQFPFYKDMKYSECLKLNDYIRYRDIERKIEALISQERTASAILMAQARVRYRFQLAQKRAEEGVGEGEGEGTGVESIVPQQRGAPVMSRNNPFVDPQPQPGPSRQHSVPRIQIHRAETDPDPEV